MNRFGIMTLSLDSESSYINGIANYCDPSAFQIFHFVPSTFDPFTEKVKGRMYNHENNTWVTGEFPIPTILYDRCFYHESSHSHQCKNIVSWLKNREDIKFIGNGLPNKLTLYDVLKESRLKAYIPRTKTLRNAEQLLAELSTAQPVIIKPINGSQGNGIYFIQKRNKEIFVKTDKKNKQVEHSFSDSEKFIAWLNGLLAKNAYLSQAYLPLYNQSKQPFDIRSLLQKKPSGKWEIVEKGIRLGEPNRIISNLSAGADVIPFRDWLKHTSFRMKNFLENEVNDILSTIPPVLEKSFPSLFELGVDIGVTANGSLWILDVNSKPGRKVILNAYPHLEEQLYKAPTLYAASILAEKGGKMNAKTVSD
ncbi:YheC/YheD family endospore coat-associated protein [Niallia sp. 01092]|uniref:YheC/YheD family endospore coat-associated protein n=1 Tax=unclassified Niallia TaxID=2837522 RepID=UPI003FCFADE8